MKASDFIYHRPASVNEAVGLLADYAGDARILAGGQSLMPMMNMRLWRPSSLIDIGGLTDLDRVGIQGESTVLGALVRYRRIESDPVIAQRLPLLPLMIRYVGDRQVRNRGTIGGSLIQADPTGEMPLAALVLGAVVNVTGPLGSRAIPLEELFVGSYATAIDVNEILVEVVYPRHPAATAFFEVNRRHNDFAVVSVAAVGDVDADGRSRGIRLGLGGVDETPVLARQAMRICEGARLDDAVVAAAAAAAAGEISPASDIRASEDYRRHLAAVYVARALKALRGAAGANERK